MPILVRHKNLSSLPALSKQKLIIILAHGQTIFNLLNSEFLSLFILYDQKAAHPNSYLLIQMIMKGISVN
jgi:hypothetical protein